MIKRLFLFLVVALNCPTVLFGALSVPAGTAVAAIAMVHVDATSPPPISPSANGNKVNRTLRSQFPQRRDPQYCPEKTYGWIRGKRRKRGAIYARYSTRFQHSIEDQIRTCRAWAEANDIEVEDGHIFFDRGKSGRTHRRSALERMMKALDDDEVDVIITFSTSRLYRKMYKSLQFIDEKVVAHRKRAVFVAQNIDTEKTEFWKQLVWVFGMLDEMHAQAQAAYVRSAQEGLLLKELVHGTLSFGYTGVEVEGKTKLGRPRRKLVVDEETAKWVRQVYHWFLVDKLKLAAIARLLTEKAPLPPRCAVGYWTRLAVRILLSNLRYVGDWSYGRKEAIWQAKGYLRQYLRERPLREHRIERLRIIDDEIFVQAQARLQTLPNSGGRRRKGAPHDAPPPLLSKLLICPRHHKPLVVAGSTMYCPACKMDPRQEPELYSQINRQRAERKVCEAIIKLVRSDPELTKKLMVKFKEYGLLLQTLDPNLLEELQKQEKSLTSQIDFVYRSPAGDDADRKQKYEQIDQLQADRKAVRRKISEIEQAQKNAFRESDEAAFKAELDRIEKTLAAACSSQDREVISAAREIIEGVTGGEILISQEGERQAKQGWLRGTFKSNLSNHLLRLGDDGAAADGEPVVIDFREDSFYERNVAEVMKRYNSGEMMADIADALDMARNQVTGIVHEFFESQGLPVPDGRSRRSTLVKKHQEPPVYQAIADKVMELHRAGKKLYEIAALLGVCLGTITQACVYWHTSRGLPLPPGQGRRKNVGSSENPTPPSSTT